jgi:hypothetical protein
VYANGTILTLKEPREADPETAEPFPYNRVEVIGPSPVTKDREGYTGPDAAGVLLRPLANFGGNLDEPFGKCKQLFDVELIPEVTVEPQQKIRVIDSQSAEAGPTPEEVFAAEAPGVPPEEGRRRGRGGVSPLGDVPNPANRSPLDAPPRPAAAVAAPPVEAPAPAPPAPPVQPPAAPATPAEPGE